MSSNTNSKVIHVRLRYVGRCQGVGFRWTCQRIAIGLGATGWVKNEDDGSVTLDIQLKEGDLGLFYQRLDASYQKLPFSFHIDAIDELPLDDTLSSFDVRY